MTNSDFSVLADIRGELPSHKTKSGVSSSFSPQKYPIPYQHGGRLPSPRPVSKFVWGVGRDIVRLPSVSPREFGSPARMHPSKVNIMHDVNIRGSTELKAQQTRFITSSPSRKARRDSLRDMPFMGLKLHAQKAVRQNIQMILRRFRTLGV